MRRRTPTSIEQRTATASIPLSKSPAKQTSSHKRMALYARVSTKEQTEGNYPSCDSQIEELRARCLAKGWEVTAVIKDEGVSAGSLKRKGLTHLRYLVETRQIDGVLCTWYDRLVRTRDFYVLDNEFTSCNVEFITLHDPTDRKTASGRFLETMLVAAKTYEREQTAEKVRIKLQMRKEKGMWNGSLIPVGFKVDGQNQMFVPDLEKKALIEGMFQVYVKTHSDAAVRDWLKSHNIPAPQGHHTWVSGAIRKVLTNRRYIAEIEINPANKGVEGLPEIEAYRVVKAPHEPLVSRELFELAQSIRQERSLQHPTRGGKPRNVSHNKCGKLYLLQGRMFCGVCGCAMTPHYTYHKPGPKRKSECYIHYYECAHQVKRIQQTPHSNRVLARRSEAWMLERITELVETEGVIEQAMEKSRKNCESDLHPQKEALALTNAAIQENQRQIDEIIQAVSSGEAKGSLLSLLSERADHLKVEREKLRLEQQAAFDALAPLDAYFDVATTEAMLRNFERAARSATAQELQRLLRLIVRRIEWQPSQEHIVEFYHLSRTTPPNLTSPPESKSPWFATSELGAVHENSKTPATRKLRAFSIFREEAKVGVRVEEPV